MKNIIILLLLLPVFSCKKETTISPVKSSAHERLINYTEGAHGVIIINNFSAAGVVIII